MFVGRLRCLKVFFDLVPGGLRGRLVYLKTIVKRGGEGGGVKEGREGWRGGRQSDCLSAFVMRGECGGRRYRPSPDPCCMRLSVSLTVMNGLKTYMTSIFFYPRHYLE